MTGLKFTSSIATLIVAVGCAACQGKREQVDPIVVPEGTARTLEFPGAITQVLLDADATKGGMAMLEITVAPRSFGAPPHVHRNEDEYFYILEGELSLLNGEEVLTASKGTMAALTRGHVHAFWNASDRPARALIAIAPGKFARFFDEVVGALRAREDMTNEEIAYTIGRIGREWDIFIFPDRVPEQAKAFLPK